MYIKVKVFLSAKKEFLVKESEDTFTVFVREPPRGGIANKRVVRLISEYCNSPARIISGHHSRSKILSIGDF